MLCTVVSTFLAWIPLPSATAGGAGTPHLEHSAPWVGGDLELTLAGAVPGASVRLFHSPSAQHTQTPFGTLELAREHLALAASGNADGQGHWSVRLPIPMDAALVEAQSHYQALVADPIGGATLSSAVHLRTLGPRSYTLCTGAPSSPSGPAARMRLDVHAVAKGERVASMELGAWSGVMPANQSLWRPVFSANLSRGALLVDADRLIVFDPFESVVLAELDVQSAFQRLLRSSDGRTAYVLENPVAGGPPRVRELDLESAAFVATLELPATCGPYWCADEGTGQAFVADVDAATGQPLARRVDLEAWSVLGPIQLRLPGGWKLLWLDVEGAWLYAGLRWIPGLGLRFVAVDLSQPASGPVVVDMGYRSPGLPVIVPDAERLFVGGFHILGPESDEVYVAPLDDPGRLTWVESTPNVPPFTFGPSVVRDDHVWVLARYYDSDSTANLWNLDALALSWWKTSDFWIFPWPVTLLATRGPLADVLLMPRTGLRSRFASFAPELMVLDGATGEVAGTWPLTWGPLAAYLHEP